MQTFSKKCFKMDCNWSVFLHLLKPISNWFECTCVKNVLKWTLIGQYFCTCWNNFKLAILYIGLSVLV